MRFRSILPAVGIVSLLATAQASAEPYIVSCAPGQRAVVRQAFVRGEPVTRVTCANGTYREGGYRTYAARRHRSWGKSALVIGGSTATGAGIGGIIRGKKGALIGSALGAGAGSLYESTKRR